MNRLLLPALLGLAALLGLVGAAELVLPGPEIDATDATGIRPAPRLPHVDTTKEVVETTDNTDEWVASILARPLFTRDRKPQDAPKSDAGAGAAEMPLPRLTGVAVTPIGRLAFFAGSDTVKPIVVAEGGSIGGYRVTSIRPGVVRVQGPGGERIIAPSYDPSPHPADTTVQPQFPQAQFPQGQFPQQQFGQPGQAQFPPGQFQPGQFPPGQFPPGQFQPGMPGQQFTPGFPRVPGMQFQGRPRSSDGAALPPSPTADRLAMNGSLHGAGYILGNVARAGLPDTARTVEFEAPPATEPT